MGKSTKAQEVRIAKARKRFNTTKILLKAGLRQKEIKDILGCSGSLISHYAKHETFEDYQEYNQRKIDERLAKSLKANASYELVSNIESNKRSPHIYESGDKVRILKTVGFGTDLSDDYTVGDICEVEQETDIEGDTPVYTKGRENFFWFPQDAIEPVLEPVEEPQEAVSHTESDFSGGFDAQYEPEQVYDPLARKMISELHQTVADLKERLGWLEGNAVIDTSHKNKIKFFGRK